MEVSLGNFLSFIALILAGYGIIRSQFIIEKENERRFTRLEENQISKMDFAAMQKQVELFWSIVQKSMADLLHSPHTPEMDILLDRLKDGELDHDGVIKLLCLLDEETEVLKKNAELKLVDANKPRLFGIALLKAGLLSRLGATEKELIK
jgi:hypothetical protein